MRLSVIALLRTTTPTPTLLQRDDSIDPIDWEPSAERVFVLQCVSLAVSTTSLLATMVSFYWFVRMRRTFRHE
jgi:hypothetical protein